MDPKAREAVREVEDGGEAVGQFRTGWSTDGNLAAS